MQAAGNVDKANILKGPDGRSKGCGIVTFQPFYNFLFNTNQTRFKLLIGKYRHRARERLQ